PPARSAAARPMPAAIPAWPCAARSGFGLDDLFPELRELLLVAGPDLVPCDLAEGVDMRLVHSHALGLEQLLGLGEVVDALGVVADALLRLARHIEQQFLLLFGQAVPDAEIDDVHRRPVVVIGHRAV